MCGGGGGGRAGMFSYISGDQMDGLHKDQCVYVCVGGRGACFYILVETK